MDEMPPPAPQVPTPPPPAPSPNSHTRLYVLLGILALVALVGAGYSVGVNPPANQGEVFKSGQEDVLQNNTASHIYQIHITDAGQYRASKQQEPDPLMKVGD